MKKFLAILSLSMILLFQASFVLAQTQTASDQCADYCAKIKSGEAATEPAGITCICNPLKYDNLSTLVKSITNWIFWAAVIVAPIMIVIAAFIFLTSAGNPTRTGTAKNMLIWTSVGLAIIIGSRLIIALIRRVLGA